MNRLVELRRDRSRRAALPWTDARIAHLKMRWSQGVTAQRIARELGGGISRSAVLGKIHRLGFAELSPRAWVHRSHLKRAGERRISHQLWAALGRTFAGQQWPPPAWVIEAKPYVEDPRIDADIPLAQRRSLLDLTRGACRWPVGDPSHPDFFFCGAEALRGELYWRHIAPAHIDRRPKQCPAPRAHAGVGPCAGITASIRPPQPAER